MKRISMRKTLSIVLSLILVLANISLVAFAADATPEYSTSENIVGYSAALVTRKDLSNVKSISEFETDVFGEITEWKISNVDDLVKFAGLVKAGQEMTGVTVYLASDMDLSSIANFESIGGWTTGWGGPKFCGKFDGQGYTIKNMNIVVPETGASADIGYFGFFRLLGVKAEICNLIFDSTCRVSAGTHANVGSIGVVCGAVDSTTGNSGATEENTVKLYNIYSAATLVHGGGIAAVFVPYAKSSFLKIDHCTAAGNMQVLADGTGAKLNSGSGVAGFVGMLGEASKNYSVSATITNSRNAVDVNGGLAPAGGFVGMACKSKSQIDVRTILIENCINNGDVTMSDVSKYADGRGVAGFVGYNNFDTIGCSVTLKNCINYGTITSPDATLDPAPTTATQVDELANDSAATTALENNIPFTAENCTKAAGQTDATLEEAMWQNLVAIADPTPSDPGNNGGQQGGNDDGQQGGNDDGQQGGNDDNQQGGNDGNTQTNAPETNDPTTEAPTTTAPVEEESGCKSVVAIVPVMLVTLGAAAFAFKKKED